jgi:hypothetical protein
LHRSLAGYEHFASEGSLERGLLSLRRCHCAAVSHEKPSKAPGKIKKPAVPPAKTAIVLTLFALRSMNKPARVKPRPKEIWVADITEKQLKTLKKTN